MSQLDAFLRESIDRYNNENDIPEASAGDELSADIAEIVGNRLSQIVAEASIRVSDGSAIATTQSLVHLHAALAGLAGALVGAIQSVQVGMGEPVLILAFVVIVIGGIGSIKGALIGALLVGLTDTLGGVLLPELFKLFTDPASAAATGSAFASMAIYVLMSGVLIWRPTGLFGARA